jgi:hypothetical protein
MCEFDFSAVTEEIPIGSCNKRLHSSQLGEIKSCSEASTSQRMSG